MDFEKLARELQSSGKAEKLRAAAESPECRKLSGLLDEKSLQRVALSGDQEALRGMLARLLETEEGRALAQRVREAMK